MTSVQDSIHNDWESDILEQFDSYAREYDFPMLNNVYFYNADARLTAFRSSSEWLIVFQEIALSQKHGFINSISAYGNKIDKTGTQQAITVISGLPSKPIWDDDNNFLLDKWDFEMVINGAVRHFTPSPEDYKRAKIDVHSNMPAPVQVLRFLSSILSNGLFIKDDELLYICDRAGSDLEKFIQLEDWYHPDIAADELPSHSVCLRNLARAIAINDKNVYVCPKDRLNTHWSNWDQLYPI